MDGIYELEVLIAALKQIKKPNMFLWNLLVRKEIPEFKAKFEVHTKNARRRMAPFVGRYSKGTFFEKEGSTIEEFEPGKILPFRRATAEELLQQQFGQTVYGEAIDSEDIAIDEVAKELEDLDTAIIRRENWLLAKLLTTGVMPIIGENINRAITFGKANIEKLSGTSLWSDVTNADTSDPIAHIKNKQLEVLKETGSLIDSVILGKDAADSFLKHPKVTEKLKYTTADVLRINPRGLGDGAKYLGTIPELEVDIYSFVDWVENPETGKDEELFPAKGVLGVKSQSIEVHYGAIAQMGEDEVNRVYTGKRIPKVWVNKSEDSKYIRLGSAPLPLPDDAKGWFFSTVL